jgi:hypothetical protein
MVVETYSSQLAVTLNRKVFPEEALGYILTDFGYDEKK